MQETDKSSVVAEIPAVAQRQIQELVIPNKYDVVPVHNSDRSSFRRCRRYWDWNSPARHNLIVRADVNGIYIPFFFGDGIHFALECYYNPLLKRDPVETFSTWFDIQWYGGIVTEEWLDKVYDLKPEPIKEAIRIPQAYADYVERNPDSEYHISSWKVRGLIDILPDPSPEEFMLLRELGIGMMTFYKDYAARNDSFEILIPEHTFSVPIWDYENDRILTAIDVREESPNYGKTLEVHARGRIDAVGVYPNGKMMMLDHKTAEVMGEDYFEKLEMDEQCTSYLWALEVEASYYDLSHRGQPVEELIYNVLRKAMPQPPTILKSGMFSVDRTNESTTYPLLSAWLDENLPGWQQLPGLLNEKQQNYLDYLRDVGDEQFIIRKAVRRNKHQLANAGKRLYLEALDMLDPNVRIYPNLSNDWKCQKCAFRAPCLARESGADWEQLIRDNYTTNKDR